MVRPCLSLFWEDLSHRQLAEVQLGGSLLEVAFPLPCGVVKSQPVTLARTSEEVPQFPSCHTKPHNKSTAAWFLLFCSVQRRHGVHASLVSLGLLLLLEERKRHPAVWPERRETKLFASFSQPFLFATEQATVVCGLGWPIGAGGK